MKIIFLSSIFFSCFGLEFSGVATDLKTNKFSYKEKHSATLSESGLFKEIKTSYLDATDSEFARIKSTFSSSDTVPESQFSDDRFSVKEESKLIENNSKTKLIRVFKDKEKTQSISIHEHSVLGQGFHNYVVKNFDNLMKNETVVDFIVLPKLDYFKFQIRFVSKDENNVNFEIKPKSFIISAFVSTIKLKYQIKTKRLLEYSGLSNLDNNSGDSQNVRIVYQY